MGCGNSKMNSNVVKPVVPSQADCAPSPHGDAPLAKFEDKTTPRSMVSVNGKVVDEPKETLDDAQNLLFGNGIEKNEARAVAILERLVNSNGPLAADASHMLGMHFIMSDPSLAVKHFRRASDLGQMAGTRMLARCYEDGRGVEPDLAEGMRLFRKGANDGDRVAMVNLANRLQFGMMGEPDLKEAALWFLKAAQLGEKSAILEAGVIYARGDLGVQKNMKEAIKWWKLAAESGDSDAQCNLGMVYRDGTHGVEKDLNEARIWYEKASVHGHVDAQKFLSGFETGVACTHSMWARAAFDPEDTEPMVESFRRKSSNLSMLSVQNSVFTEGRGTPRCMTPNSPSHASSLLSNSYLGLVHSPGLPVPRLSSLVSPIPLSPSSVSSIRDNDDDCVTLRSHASDKDILGPSQPVF